MFRVAAGEELGYDDPLVEGHSIEFRINAEDAGRNFMPAPGTLTRWHAPSGPGVRLDGGYDQGETVPGSFDSLVAKLIVTGRNREQALERSRRALDEFVVDGMPTVIPFHRAVVDDPAYVAADGSFGVYTSWIETEFDNTIAPYDGEAEVADPAERENVTVEVAGKRIQVSLPAGLGRGRCCRPGRNRRSGRHQEGRRGRQAATRSTAPMQGTIVKLAVEEGQQVAAGELVVVLEAMKMEQPINAHKAGTIIGPDRRGRRHGDQRRGALRDQRLSVVTLGWRPSGRATRAVHR